MPSYLLLLLLATFVPCIAGAQEAATQSKTDSDEFFSGNVVEMGPDHVTVSRTVGGQPAETRTFKINEATKVEGKMRAKSRVTVRYAAADGGDVALSILVREHADKGAKRK